MSNINDSYFDGYYKEIWKIIIPDELTVKEADFMFPYFHLQPGSNVLDLMCGYGRHAIALARKGITVTAVDNLPEYINEIKRAVEKENLPVNAVLSGALDFNTAGKFELAICMGNSLNFFNAADTVKLLKNINSFLKPGGQLLINSWSVAEIAIKNFKDKSWSQIGDMKFLVESKFHFHPSRIEAEHTIIAPGGKSETKKGIDYVFSINEMETMLNQAGFQLKEVFSIPGKKKFTIGDPRAYLVAKKS